MDLAGSFLTALQLGMPNLAPSACIFEAALLFFVFRNHLAYRHTPSFAIHRDEQHGGSNYAYTYFPHHGRIPNCDDRPVDAPASPFAGNRLKRVRCPRRHATLPRP